MTDGFELNELDDENLFHLNSNSSSRGHQLKNFFYRFTLTRFRYVFMKVKRNIFIKNLIILISTILICYFTLKTLFGINDPIREANYYYYDSLNRYQPVASKFDLLNVDISDLLRYKNFDKSAVTDFTKNQPFKTYKFTSFLTNLDINMIDRIKNKLNKAKNIGSSNADSLLSVTEYENLIECDDLKYTNKIEYSKWNPLLTDNMVEVRRDVLNLGTRASKIVYKKGDVDKMKEEDIVKKKWLRFGSSGLWLESENCYVVYTRILYIDNRPKDEPTISFIRGQAFDKDWNELKGKKIPFIDVKLPFDSLDKHIEHLKEEFGVKNCNELYSSNTNEFETCKINQAKDLLKTKKRIDSVLDRYYVTYPMIANLPIDADSKLFVGPEDARTILKKNDPSIGYNSDEEPLLVYNELDADGKRRIFTLSPHRSSDKIIKLKTNDFNLRKVEKNWTPFFHQNDKSTKFSRGFVHMIYSYSPLEILKCSLDDGYCQKVFQGKLIALSEEIKNNDLRGGTQFVPLPPTLPKVKNRQIWVGFPKLHATNCGCGDAYYRPMLSVLIEKNGIYHLELIAPTIDFDKNVLSWDNKGDYCDEINVMSPNSISFWEIVSQDPKTKLFEDYMTIQYSEADTLSYLITIRGLLNYVLGIYAKHTMKDSFEITNETSGIIKKTGECVKNLGLEICKKYGLEHVDPNEQKKKEEEEKKKQEEEEKKKKEEEEKKKKEEEEKKKKEEEENKKKEEEENKKKEEKEKKKEK